MRPGFLLGGEGKVAGPNQSHDTPYLDWRAAGSARCCRRGPKARPIYKAYLFVKVEGPVSGLPQFDAAAHPLPDFLPEPCFSF